MVRRVERLRRALDARRPREGLGLLLRDAFRALLDGFPGLSWDNRLLILVPDDDFKSKLEPHLQRSLQAMRPVQLVGAEEATAGRVADK